MYATSFEAANGSGSYSWSVSCGNLPLSMGFDGAVLTGTAPAGVYLFTVTVSDGTMSASADYTWVVNTMISDLVIVSPDTISGSVGTDVGWSFAATGGVVNYVWNLVDGSLPQGVSLSTDGQLTGAVSSDGSWSFVVRVTDEAGTTADQNVTLQITTPPPELVITSSETLSDGSEGQGYNFSFSANGGAGAPYAWNVSNGSLPGGMGLSDNMLSGTPASGGLYSWEMQVTDAGGNTATQTVSWNVTFLPPPPLQFNPPDFIPVSIWSPFQVGLSATGGAGPLAWSFGEGSPPLAAGAAIDPNTGTLTGTLGGTEGNYTCLVSVTDGYDTVTAWVTLTAADRDLDGDGLMASYEHTLGLAHGLTMHDGNTHSSELGCHDWLIYYDDQLRAGDRLGDVDGDGLGSVLEGFLGTSADAFDTDGNGRTGWCTTRRMACIWARRTGMVTGWMRRWRN